uniref:Ribonuclease H2 subunit B n=1 Tax=Steinernema glaseri TaxID=37863 RepID=A0A1I7ZVJ9_9BILA
MAPKRSTRPTAKPTTVATIESDLSYARKVLICKGEFLTIHNLENTLSDDKEAVLLPHPRTGASTLYYGVGSESISQVVKVGEGKRSWLMGESVVSDGNIVCFVPVHPLFLILPYLKDCTQSNALPTELSWRYLLTREHLEVWSTDPGEVLVSNALKLMQEYLRDDLFRELKVSLGLLPKEEVPDQKVNEPTPLGAILTNKFYPIMKDLASNRTLLVALRKVCDVTTTSDITNFKLNNDKLLCWLKKKFATVQNQCSSQANALKLMQEHLRDDLFRELKVSLGLLPKEEAPDHKSEQTFPVMTTLFTEVVRCVVDMGMQR